MVSDLHRSVDRSSPWLGQKSSRSTFEVVDSSDYAGSVTGLDAFDPSLPTTEARRAGPGRRGGLKPSSGTAPAPTPGRRSPDDDPATTAYPGCMRQAVDDLSAGGLVGLDVDFAEWSGWYLLVASRLMGSGNGGARSASMAVSTPAPGSQPAGRSWGRIAQ